MIDQQWHVRADAMCIMCGEQKSEGTLLCWPCHHKEKRRNDGGYSKACERALAGREAELKRGKAP